MTNVLGFLGHPRSRTAGGLTVFTDWDSGWYHNSAAAVINETGVLAAVEQERLTRKKNTGVFPTEAIEYCMGAIRGAPDLVAFGETGGFGELRDPFISVESVRRLLSDECGINTSETEVMLVDHHTSHALSAAMASSYEDALVVTLDGFGDGVSGSFRMMTHRFVEPPHRVIPFNASLGRFYSSTLSYLGYRDGDEYKVMGLAPFGDPDRLKSFIDELYSLEPDGAFKIADHDQDAMFQRLERLGERRRPGAPFTAHHADVAATFQDALERIVLHVLHHEVASCGTRLLCFAGGVAHNSSMIGKLQRELRLEDLFVQPAADDSGIALGAAYAGLDKLGAKPPRGLDHVFLGPDIEESAVSAAIGKWADWITVERPRDPVDAIARLLADGAVVGMARGRMEFGPRALGNRSILADPRPGENKDRVNRLVKSRESYRPFAPATTQEDAGEYFDLDLPLSSYRFMTIVGRVRPRFRSVLAAVTHVDGTARVQTTARSANPYFHSLLKRFGDLTGVPVLLNTSLNNHREPIVATAEDALIFLLTSGVDCLVLGDDLIVRRTAGRSPADLFRNARYALRRGTIVCTVEREGTLAYVATGPERRELKLNKAAFDVLSNQTCADVYSDALDALFLLWTERLIDVIPDQSHP